MTVFIIVLSIVIIQRLVELMVARRNEIWMKAEGAIEAGASHYPYMVAMHAAFFVSLIVEFSLSAHTLSPVWPLLLTIFIAAQVLRIWCLSSLGKFWNTKIIVLPDAKVVRKGPYRFIKHPNYVIVATELLCLPLLFNAYVTAVLFTALNIWMMTVRIPAEENALKEATNYKEEFS